MRAIAGHPRPHRGHPNGPLLLGLALYLVLTATPLLALALDTVRAVLAEPGLLREAIPGGRRLPLFLRSLTLSLGAASLAMGVALLAARRLWRRHVGGHLRLRALALALAPVPAYVHSLSWLPLRTAIERRVGPDAVGALSWLASGWVMAMAALPLALLVTLVALESVPRPLTDAASVLGGDDHMLRRVLWPLAAPLMVLGLALLFLQNLLDYSVPTLYQLNVYAMEVFVTFSEGNEAARAVLVALPLLLLGAVVTALLSRGAGRIAAAAGARERPAARRLGLGRGLRIAEVVAFGLFLAQVLVPLITLLRLTGTPRRLLEAWRSAGPEIGYSFAVAALAGLATLPPALAMALRLQQRGRGWRDRLWWALALLPLAVPPALVGIGLVGAYNRPPLLLHGTDLMPVLAAAARFIPLQTLLIFGQLQRQDPALLDAARVYQASPWAGWRAVRLPLLLPGLIGASAAGFALALGELGATLVVTPPGRSTLTLRIYNYLHYGASDAVAALCLSMVVLAMLAGLAAGWLLSRGGWSPPMAEAGP